MYLTGTLRQQVMHIPFLLADLEMCIYNERHSSSLQSYANQYCCIKKYLFHCLLSINQISEIHPRENNSKASASPRYCGALFLKEYKVHSSDMVELIEIIKGHILYHKILKFNFRTSRAISCGDHGLVFYHQGFRSDHYCGRRVPWTIIVRSDKSYIHLVFKSYLSYELSIFYSSFQRNWIRRYIHVKLLYLQYNEFKFNDENIYSVQCYILADPDKLIYLNVLSTGPLNGSVMAHDGPGRLSNIILQLNSTISLINVKASTTAYWAFVEVVLPQTIDTVIKLIVQTSSMRSLSVHCYRQGKIYIPDTAIYRRNIICSTLLEAPSYRMFVSLFVHNFIFHAPSQLTDTSPSSCQYGGLTVYFHPVDKGFELCQDMRNLEMGSGSNVLRFTLVWFYGYSRGSFEGYIHMTNCRSIYLEHEYPGSIYMADILFKLETYPYCYQVICPPKHVEIQRSCIIQLGPPSVGTTTIKIITVDTLEPCDRGLRLADKYIKESISHTINASFSEHWPFGLMNSSRKSYQRYNTADVTLNYEFLHSATMKSTLLCSEKSPLKQMAVFVGTSLCKKINDKVFFHMTNHIAVLTDSCMQMTYTALIVQGSNSNKLYYDFIYKGDGRITTGHLIDVQYGECPIACGNFNYSVFVISKDGSTVIEDIAQVGYKVFTGHYHKGFRVTIRAPDNDCVPKGLCQIQLTIFKPPYPIGTKDYDLESFYFQNER